MPTKVLLVEDDPALSDAVREGLSDENMEMVVVSNVKDGLEQIRTQRPDAVVLDLMLAGESGFELLRAVRSQRDQRSGVEGRSGPFETTTTSRNDFPVASCTVPP